MIGKVVWYFPGADDFIKQAGVGPYAALIAKVNDDGTVNVSIDAGRFHLPRSNVTLVQDGEVFESDKSHCEWMRQAETMTDEHIRKIVRAEFYRHETDEMLRERESEIQDRVNELVQHGPVTMDELLNFFTYHPPQTKQLEQYALIRSQALGFAGSVLETCPHCPERSAAINAIREAAMWANAAIACRG
jgi:hypothetical protein